LKNFFVQVRFIGILMYSISLMKK